MGGNNPFCLLSPSQEDYSASFLRQGVPPDPYKMIMPQVSCAGPAVGFPFLVVAHVALSRNYATYHQGRTSIEYPLEETGPLIPPERTSIVLVEPSLAVNVGAVARAMKNMGFSGLRLVCPHGASEHLSDPARRMASGAEDVLEQARVFHCLDDALADIQVVAGCTARKGKGRHPVLDPQGLRENAAGYGPQNRLGIVFGREDRGLTNAELDLCHLVVTIPTAPEHPSLNLAQAVLLVCYELVARNAEKATRKSTRGSPATSEELEELYRHGREVLLRIRFLDPQNPDRILRVLRRILGRAGPDSREVKILRGILRQMDWFASKVEKGKESAET